MAIIVETGSGVPNANSYVTLSYCDTYFETKGYTTWVNGDDDLKECAIINACDYMETLMWKGQKALSTYVLSWPRRGVYDADGYPIYSDTIPLQVQKAQCELALRFFQNKAPLADVSSGDSYIIKEVVGPIEISYSSSHPPNVQFPEVEALLRPWINSKLSVEMERA